MSRGAIPSVPGTRMAGTVEVFDISVYGTHYVTPVGTNTPSGTNAFEYASLSIMATEEKTVVTLPDGSDQSLTMGESFMLSVEQGEEIRSNYPVMVHLITGDAGSTHQIRSFSYEVRQEVPTQAPTTPTLYNSARRKNLRVR
jgi:hypothetical protein